MICHHHGPKKGVLHLIDPSHPQRRGSCALGEDTRDRAEDSRATGPANRGLFPQRKGRRTGLLTTHRQSDCPSWTEVRQQRTDLRRPARSLPSRTPGHRTAGLLLGPPKLGRSSQQVIHSRVPHPNRLKLSRLKRCFLKHNTGTARARAQVGSAETQIDDTTKTQKHTHRQGLAEIVRCP